VSVKRETLRGKIAMTKRLVNQFKTSIRNQKGNISQLQQRLEKANSEYLIDFASRLPDNRDKQLEHRI
jgi:exonuclease VII large subunit